MVEISLTRSLIEDEGADVDAGSAVEGEGVPILEDLVVEDQTNISNLPLVMAHLRNSHHIAHWTTDGLVLKMATKERMDLGSLKALLHQTTEPSQTYRNPHRLT